MEGLEEAGESVWNKEGYENGEWIVETEHGDIRCEFVVNAAGYYAQRVGEWFKPYGGRTVPMMVMSHQYVLTEQVGEVEAWSKEHGGKLPLLRDVDVSYYLRQEKNGFNIGPYEPNCKGHWMTDDDPMPDDFSFQLYPDDLDRIMDIVADAHARGTTVVVATHDPSLLERYRHRRLELAHGRLVLDQRPSPFPVSPDRVAGTPGA